MRVVFAIWVTHLVMRAGPIQFQQVGLYDSFSSCIASRGRGWCLEKQKALLVTLMFPR